MYKSSYTDHITAYSDSDNERILKKAGEALNELFGEYHGLPLLFMTSGGSSLKLLSYIDELYLGPHLTITTLDERFTSASSINNFVQLSQTSFYKKAIKKKCTFIDTSIQDKTVKDAAERFEFELHHLLKMNPQTIIIATLGMGSDGHTAGIIPGVYYGKEFNSHFEGSLEKWIVGYNTKGKGQIGERITPTFYFLTHYIKASIIYISGNDKKNALDRLLDRTGSLEDTPALITRQMKKIQLFTDI